MKRNLGLSFMFLVTQRIVRPAKDERPRGAARPHFLWICYRSDYDANVPGRSFTWKIHGWNLTIIQLKRKIIFHPPPLWVTVTAVNSPGCKFGLFHAFVFSELVSFRESWNPQQIGPAFLPSLETFSYPRAQLAFWRWCFPFRKGVMFALPCRVAIKEVKLLAIKDPISKEHFTHKSSHLLRGIESRW